MLGVVVQQSWSWISILSTHDYIGLDYNTTSWLDRPISEVTVQVPQLPQQRLSAKLFETNFPSFLTIAPLQLVLKTTILSHLSGVGGVATHVSSLIHQDLMCGGLGEHEAQRAGRAATTAQEN